MPNDTSKKSVTITGNIGLYYVCYQLSRRGWNVMPTARNTKGIDIVAYEGSGEGFIGIQVKTLSKKNPVPLPKSLEKEDEDLPGDYWIIVSNVTADSAPDVFVMLPSEVKEAAHRGEKDGRISYWLQPRAYGLDLYKNAWERLKVRPPCDRAR